MTDHDVQARWREFHDDGVTVLRGALDADALARARAAFDWSLAHPGPATSLPFAGIDGAFHQDLCNPAASGSDACDGVLRHTPIGPVGAPGPSRGPSSRHVQVRPGGSLEVGTVRCEVVAYAFSCPQKTQWFCDGTST
jgi:hypothetical protein